MSKLWRIKKEHINGEGCFAYGGGVPDEEETPATPFQMPTSASVNPFGDFFSAPTANPNAVPEPDIIKNYDPKVGLFGTPAAPQVAPQAPPMPQVQSPAAETSQAPMAAPTANPYMKEAAIQGSIARDQSKIMADQERLINNAAAETQLHQQALTSKRDEIVKYLDQNPVDAQRYYKSQSDLGKISTVFGLILGGLGGGLNKTGGNVALDFLNKQIDQDVHAQIENRNTKSNLLSHLERQMGSEQDAQKMLQSTLQTQMANKLQQAALASGDKLAMARAEQVSAQLMAQANAPLAAAAAEKSLNSALASGQDMASISPFMDQKQRDRAIPGMGLATTAQAAKKMNEEVVPAYQGALQGIQELRSLSGTSDKINPRSRALASAAQTRVIGQLRMVLLGPGTISDSERSLIKDVVANPTDIFSIANSDKLNVLENALKKDFEARAKQSGVPVPQAARQPSGQVKIQFTPKK